MEHAAEVHKDAHTKTPIMSVEPSLLCCLFEGASRKKDFYLPGDTRYDCRACVRSI